MREDKIHVLDKAKNNHSYYCKSFYILEIMVKNGYKFNGWSLNIANNIYTGDNRESLITKLLELKTVHNLEVYNKQSKDILIIYIDELAKIRGYFNDLITYDGALYVQLFDNIEFRSYESWTKDEGILATMEHWFSIFIKDKYFYLTPSQCMRKRIDKVMKNKAIDIYPEYDEYLYFMSAITGGVLYCPIGITSKLMQSYDICSAYIYGLVFKTHCSSKPVLTDVNKWNNYLKNEFEGSIGTYEIEYYCPVSTISCYKDINGNNLKSGKHKVTITLTNIDLNLLFTMKHMNITNCECKLLYTFDMDYLPNEFKQLCIDTFVEKLHTDKNSVAYKNIKVLLNGGFFGNLILKDVQRVYDDVYKETHDVREATRVAKSKYNAKKDIASTSPLWGIFTMSYARELVFKLGNLVSGWRYSDTDSIYCDNTISNKQLIDEANFTIYSQNLALCEEFGYDPEIAILGTFEFEHDITYFRVWNNKTYGFITSNNKVIIKAAGCNKKELADLNPDIIKDLKYKPKVGTRLFKAYDENGYYEATACNEIALLKSLMLSK